MSLNVLNHPVVHNLGDGVQHVRCVGEGRGLFVPRFRLHPLGFRVHHLLIDLGELLGRHVLDVAREIGDDAVLLLVSEQGLLRLFDLFPLLLDPVVQPPHRVLGRPELGLQILVDVGARNGVRYFCGQCPVLGQKAHVHEAAVPDRLHLDPSDDGGDQARVLGALVGRAEALLLGLTLEHGSQGLDAGRDLPGDEAGEPRDEALLRGVRTPRSLPASSRLITSLATARLSMILYWVW